MNDSLKGLEDAMQSPNGQESGLGDQFEDLQQLIQDGAPFADIAEQGRELNDALESLGSNHDDGADGLADWADALAQDVSEAVLLAGIDNAIQDAIANGMVPGGPLGPGGLIPGGGPAAGPGAGGPGGFAPGGGGGPGPGPGFPGGPGGLLPGGGGGPGPGPGGPGGIIPPPGGGGGGGGGGGAGGFDIDIHIDLWFGHGFGHGWFGHGCCCPMVCFPGLPWGHCCWIGPHVLVCGTGGYHGHTCVCWGPPAFIGLPYCTVAPLPNALPHANYLGRILLLNPSENLGEIHYLLAGDPFAMEAGMMQEVRRTATVIRFDRGPGFGEARYTLRPGTYKFVVTDDGWDLVKVTFEATLDNTANASDFHLLLDDEPVTVPARSQQAVTSPYPPLVEFNNGSEVVRKQLADEKVYTIGINDSGRWDLFPGNAIASGAGEAGQMQLIAAAEGVEPPHEINLPTE